MRRRLLALLIVLILTGTVLVGIAYAQTGSGFDLSWNVISGGGGSGPMTGSGYKVTATLGQTAVGSSSGSGFSISHGFWNIGIISYLLNLPATLKNH
jgi:hypothetical protein